MQGLYLHGAYIISNSDEVCGYMLILEAEGLMGKWGHLQVVI